jgi:hypothetical protein
MLDLRRQDFIALLGVFLDGTPIGRKCSRFANLARIPSSSTTAGCLRGIFNSEDTMRLIVIFSLLLSATTAIAAPAEKKARTAEQACQAQALASIARQWPNVVQGYFEIIIKGNRCLVFLETPGVFAGKRVARLIDGKTGDLLSEFDGPKDTKERGLCSYRGGKFPTSECTWDEYLAKAEQM